jgi:hypothetical protein
MSTVEDLLPDHLKEGLSQAERKLLQCLPVGEIADFRAGEEAEDDPEQWSSWGPERTIRADLLAYLCSSQQVHALVHPKGLQVKGARIHGMLDVEGATISFGLSLQDGAIPDGLILSNARIGRLALDGSYLGPVTGDNMVIEGPMLLKQVRVRGQVQLETMRIGSNLDCTDGHFENPEGNALNFDQASIKGHVFLDTGFQAKGQVRLFGADIGGQLNCTEGHFENPKGNALLAELLIVRQVLSLNNLYLDGTLNLGGAKVGFLVDDQSSWPGQGALIIEGFEYTAFAGDVPVTAEGRLKWLRLQPHERRFVPQTYDQLAIVFRRMGLEADATRVMIAKQKDLIRYG